MPTTVNQVENTIKPYKYDVECTEEEWRNALAGAIGSLESRVKSVNAEITELRASVGRRRMRQAISYLDRQKDDNDTTTHPFSSSVLSNARKARVLGAQSNVLALRLSALKSRACKYVLGKSCCPEVYLHMLATKLAYTSAMFIDVEMLGEVYHDLPRALERELYYAVRGEDVSRFAEENMGVKKHLEWIKRREVLQSVLEKLNEMSTSSK